MRKLLIIFSIFLFVGCTQKKEVPKDYEIGQYAYIDGSSCLHINKRCRKIWSEEKSGAAYIDTTQLSKNQLGKTCTLCVSDANYSELLRIASKAKDENPTNGWH
jgi:hypothetical protein